jgi:hypothetical protein
MSSGLDLPQPLPTKLRLDVKMTQTSEWVPSNIMYTLWCSESVYGLNVTVTMNPVNVEADIDTAIEGLAATYGAIHTVTNITKLYTGTGVSSYDYTIVDGVGSDAGDGITQYAEGWAPIEDIET